MKTYYPPKGLRKYYFKKFFIILLTIFILIIIISSIVYSKEIKSFLKSKGIFKDKQNKCIEKWNCKEWSSCFLGSQNRTCSDINNCGTSFYEPTSSRNCIEQSDIQLTNNENFCGLSMILSKNIPINQLNFESDGALVCMGRKILNNCSSSQSILITHDIGELNYIIKGQDEFGDCILRIEFGDKDQISTTEFKDLANTQLECPMNIKQLIESNTGDSNLETMPATLAFSAYYSIGLLALSPQNQTHCSGNYLEVLNKLS